MPGSQCVGRSPNWVTFRPTDRHTVMQPFVLTSSSHLKSVDNVTRPTSTTLRSGPPSEAKTQTSQTAAVLVGTGSRPGGHSCRYSPVVSKVSVWRV